MRKNVYLFLFLILFLVSSFFNIGSAKEVKILEGHRAPISDFTVTADGRELVSLDSEGKIKFWSLDTYKVIKEFCIYSAPYFTHIDISDTKRYIALSGEEVVWIFDTIKKKVIFKIEGTESKGLFLQDERLIYLRDGYINILNLRDKKYPIKKIRFSYVPPDDIILSPSKRYLSLYGDKYLLIFDLEKEKIIQKINGKFIEFSFLGDKKFISYTKGMLLLYDIKGNEVPILHPENIEYLKGSSNGEYLFISSEDSLSLYKIEKDNLKKLIQKAFGPIQKWIFLKKGISAFLSLGSNEITLVYFHDFSAIANLGGYSLPIDKVRFSYSGHFLLAGLKDGDSYLFRMYNIKHHTFIENDLFSSCIDFEASVTSDKVAILDPNYDLYIYNLKTLKVEKVIPEVREELLLFRKNLIYTFFGYNNLGIYNIENEKFDSINLNTMPFLHPTVSDEGTIATLGEDGNIWIYLKNGHEAKKIELPSEVKEKLQAEEIGITIPTVVFTGKRGELILSIPENDKFTIEKIENFRSKEKLNMEGPIIGTIEKGKYYLQEVTSKSTGKVFINILTNKFKKIKTIKMDDALISSYDYARGFLIIGDYGGTTKIVRLKDMKSLMIRIFADGNWIIMNNEGKFSAGEGIEKYLNMGKEEIAKHLKKNIMVDFFNN